VNAAAIMSRQILQAVCVLGMVAACASPSAPTPPTTANVAGRWVLSTPGVVDQVSLLQLTQVGSEVTGTWERTAAFVMSDKGPISGRISGSGFTFSAQIVTEYTPRFPGDEDSPCRIQTTFIGGTLTVKDGSMTGLVRADASACVPRPSAVMETWTRN
jgi:hypothetical protein